MTLTPELFIVFAVPVVTCLAWLFQLKGRVDTHQESIADVKDDLRYIRERIDTALNGKH